VGHPLRDDTGDHGFVSEHDVIPARGEGVGVVGVVIDIVDSDGGTYRLAEHEHVCHNIMYPNEAPIILVTVEGDPDTAAMQRQAPFLFAPVEFADVGQEALVAGVLRLEFVLQVEWGSAWCQLRCVRRVFDDVLEPRHHGRRCRFRLVCLSFSLVGRRVSAFEEAVVVFVARISVKKLLVKFHLFRDTDGASAPTGILDREDGSCCLLERFRDLRLKHCSLRLSLQFKKLSVLVVSFLFGLSLENSGVGLGLPGLHVDLALLFNGRVFQRAGEDEGGRLCCRVACCGWCVGTFLLVAGQAIVRFGLFGEPILVTAGGARFVVVIRHRVCARVCGGRGEVVGGDGVAFSDVLTVCFRVPMHIIDEWGVKYAIDEHLVMLLEEGALAYCAVGRGVEVHE